MRPNPYKHMHVAELLAVIDDTIFQKETDKEIAINVFVRSMTVEKAASKVGYDCKTVQRRLPGIEERINLHLKN